MSKPRYFYDTAKRQNGALRFEIFDGEVSIKEPAAIAYERTAAEKIVFALNKVHQTT